MKKTMAALLAALVLGNVPAAFAAEALTEKQISEAQVKANKLIPPRKVNFAYLSMGSSENLQGGHFLKDDRRADADAYWLNPFCCVMNEQIDQTRSGNRDFSAFAEVAKVYQLRLLFDIRGFNKESFLAAQITVSQNGKMLTPSRVRYAPLQRSIEPGFFDSQVWQRVGVVLDFPAEEVEADVPVTVCVTGDGGTPLTFEPLENKKKYNAHETKSHEFLWYPLHDSL